MSDIPDDIRKAAEAVIDRGYDEGMVEALERALMNERERCAKIADKVLRQFDDIDGPRQSVVAAIRGG